MYNFQTVEEIIYRTKRKTQSNKRQKWDGRQQESMLKKGGSRNKCKYVRMYYGLTSPIENKKANSHFSFSI